MSRAVAHQFYVGAITGDSPVECNVVWDCSSYRACEVFISLAETFGLREAGKTSACLGTHDFWLQPSVSVWGHQGPPVSLGTASVVSLRVCLRVQMLLPLWIWFSTQVLRETVYLFYTLGHACMNADAVHWKAGPSHSGGGSLSQRKLALLVAGSESEGA